MTPNLGTNHKKIQPTLFFRLPILVAYTCFQWQKVRGNLQLSEKNIDLSQLVYYKGLTQKRSRVT